MFGKIASFEFRYQMRSPVFWVAFAILFLLTFAATTASQLSIGSIGAVHKNSPYAIAYEVSLMNVFALVAFVAFVANIVVRDDEAGYAPIIRSTPITKFQYLFGRFAGAFAVSALVVMSLPLGILIGSFMPWVDAMKIGPFRLDAYLYTYVVLVLPTLFVLCAGFFALATATRSMMATYVGAVGFLIGFFVLTALFAKPQYDWIVGLLEPFGIGALQETTKYWTTADRNFQIPPFSDVMLYNRAIWFSISFLFLAIAYWAFRAEGKGVKRARAEKAEPPVVGTRSGPLPAPHFDRASVIAQAWKWTRFEMAQVFRSPAFFVLLALGILNSAGGLIFAGEQAGWTVLPVTNLMINILEGSFSFIPLIVAVYYAGELVWRERERRTHEVFDACPVPDWAFVAPKIAAISLVLTSMFVLSVVVAVALQAWSGFFEFNLSHYFLWYIVPNTILAVLVATLAIFVQAVSPHKYVGWAAMVLIQIALISLGNLGYDQRLYLYGSTPPVPLSDMNGEGTFWIGRAWLQTYWSAFALMLSIFAYALWRRGAETRLKPDWRGCLRG